MNNIDIFGYEIQDGDLVIISATDCCGRSNLFLGVAKGKVVYAVDSYRFKSGRTYASLNSIDYHDITREDIRMKRASSRFKVIYPTNEQREYRDVIRHIIGL